MQFACRSWRPWKNGTKVAIEFCNSFIAVALRAIDLPNGSVEVARLSLHIDTSCRSGTFGAGADARKSVELFDHQPSRFAGADSGFDYGFVHEHDGNIVLDGINASASCALEALAIIFQLQRLLARGADENVEKILRNHHERFYVFREGKGNHVSSSARQVPRRHTFL